MIKYAVKASYLIAFLFINGIDFCPTHVCLTWRLSENQLQLKCKIDKLHFRVDIKNPDGKVVGNCFPGYKPKCESFSSNVNVAQNVETNETFCHVNDFKSDHVNGNWKCVHGTKSGEANVEVTVLVSGENSCLRKTLGFTIIGFIVTIITGVLILYCFKLQIQKEGGTKETSQDCASDKCKTFRSKLVYKTVTFAGLTLILFVVSALVGRGDNETCVATYIFSAFAIIYGNILIIFFWYNKKKKQGQNIPTVHFKKRKQEGDEQYSRVENKDKDETEVIDS